MRHSISFSLNSMIKEEQYVDFWWDAINDASEHDLMHIMYIYLEFFDDYCNDY